MTLSVASTVYEHADKGGRAHYFGVGRHQRYHAFRPSDLLSVGLHERISSTVLYPRANADPALILVDSKPFWFVQFPGFFGPFLQISNLSDAERFANLGNHGFNDETTCMLLAATGRGSEFRLSFRDVFESKWKSVLDGQLAGSPASRNGDPLLTWEMFPTGISYLDPNLTYLKIHQKLDVAIPWWPDYEATVTYHIFLYVTGGNVRGFVARWAYWVEGGVKSDDVAEKLEPKVIAGMDTLNAELDAQLRSFDGFGLADLYYLPGRQTSPVSTVSGWTTDDVTIVLEL